MTEEELKRIESEVNSARSGAHNIDITQYPEITDLEIKENL